MIRFKYSAKKLLTLSMAAVTALTMSLTAFADEPYTSYNYDKWDDPIPSQSGYRVERTITGKDMGLERLKDSDDYLYMGDDAAVNLSGARDMFYDSDRDEFWIADTGNSRLLRFEADFTLIGCYYGVYGDTEINVDENGLSKFYEPQGLFVTTSPSTGNHTVYVADSQNSRLVRAEVESSTELSLVQEFTKPDSALYTIETFIPLKVLADNAENIYTVVRSVNSGAVQFASDGSFTGYYGANRVEVTAAVVAQNLWRKIASNEQISAMKRNVPVEYSNFDIDDDGFIYTVTESDVSTDAVKKLNPAGYNIWDNSVGDKYEFGDITDSQWDATTNSTHSTRLTDIAIGENGVMNVLDYETGRVFQYDRNATLMCIFGTKNSTSDQRGTVSNPNAVEARGEKVYILDGSKNDVTVFTETSFGNYLHNAFELYDQGRYTEAVNDWQEVIKRDGSYTMAYVGLGKAALNNEQYTEALDYFKTAYDRDDYDKAYKYAREDFLRENFTVIIIIIVVLIVLLIVNSILQKKGIKLIKKKKREGA